MLDTLLVHLDSYVAEYNAQTEYGMMGYNLTDNLLVITLVHRNGELEYKIGYLLHCVIVEWTNEYLYQDKDIVQAFPAIHSTWK